MALAIRAEYKKGMFRPLDRAEGLTENQVIELEIHPLPPVTSTPRVMGGKPCMTGTRMPIDWVMGYLETGRTLEEFLEDYPQYGREQVMAAIHYAVQHLGYPALPTG